MKMKDVKKDSNELLTISEASKWASQYLNKKVSSSNISYLIQYGKVKKRGNNKKPLVSKNDLMNYYESFIGRREIDWKERLGEDIDWELSFDHLREKDTTKHVHRLHPYKGKFIPQLVEYFLNGHVDKYKKVKFFNKGDIILDPFCGSGTTLVQSNELGMHCIGIDISIFNTMISNAKISNYDLEDVNKEIQDITNALNDYTQTSQIDEFEEELLNQLYIFNDKYFPTPDFRYKVSQKQIDEFEYGKYKEKQFLPIYKDLIQKYDIKLEQLSSSSFLDEWYIFRTREEIDFAYDLISQIKNQLTKKLLSIILSRTVRSCRATTHSDLATLKKPQLTTYYCVKHKKICKPLFSITKKWITYSKDTIKRLNEFNKLRTDTYQVCLTGDARTINIFKELDKINKPLAELAHGKKIRGIFTSPPYVGLIDYHKQHEYAYDLFGFKRMDDLEIGPLCKGSGQEARESYVKGIADVLNNCKKYLVDDYDIFIVANDKFNLYPIIAEKSEMKIVKQYKRPVLNRTERDKAAYSEIIFHLKNT